MYELLYFPLVLCLWIKLITMEKWVLVMIMTTVLYYFQKKSSMFWELYHSYQDYHPAVYTHCYDTTGTRLFVAGGPLPAFLEGCYLGLWQ